MPSLSPNQQCHITERKITSPPSDASSPKKGDYERLNLLAPEFSFVDSLHNGSDMPTPRQDFTGRRKQFCPDALPVTSNDSLGFEQE